MTLLNQIRFVWWFFFFVARPLKFFSDAEKTLCWLLWSFVSRICYIWTVPEAHAVTGLRLANNKGGGFQPSQWNIHSPSHYQGRILIPWKKHTHTQSEWLSSYVRFILVDWRRARQSPSLSYQKKKRQAHYMMRRRQSAQEVLDDCILPVKSLTVLFFTF